jgi:hypothetical protein
LTEQFFHDDKHREGREIPTVDSMSVLNSKSAWKHVWSRKVTLHELRSTQNKQSQAAAVERSSVHAPIVHRPIVSVAMTRQRLLPTSPQLAKMVSSLFLALRLCHGSASHAKQFRVSIRFEIVTRRLLLFHQSSQFTML